LIICAADYQPDGDDNDDEESEQNATSKFNALSLTFTPANMCLLDIEEDSEEEETPPSPPQPAVVASGPLGLTTRVSSTIPPPPPQPVFYPIDNRRSFMTRHPITGETLPDSPQHPARGVFPADLRMNHGIHNGPSNIQLMGFAGLEQSPLLGQIVSNEEKKTQYQSYFQYDDATCATGVLYYERPRMVERGGEMVLDVHGRGGEYEVRGTEGESWLYMRKTGEVSWRRDLWTERGSGEYLVDMRGWINSLPGGSERWEWKQIWGDLLTVNAEMNLWVCVRKPLT